MFFSPNRRRLGRVGDFSETARSAERSCFSNLHVPCPWGASLKLELVPPSKSFFSNPSRVLPVGCFRVEPAVADWLPHSPVRAQLRHTVLQARISLRSYLWLFRCHVPCWHRVLPCCVSHPQFPSPTSPFPTRWLPRFGSPLFARYYEDAKTSDCSSRRSSFSFERRLPP
jgi:hypothetical protein